MIVISESELLELEARLKTHKEFSTSFMEGVKQGHNIGVSNVIATLIQDYQEEEQEEENQHDITDTDTIKSLR